MLKPAQLYESAIAKEYAKRMYEDRYKFYRGTYGDKVYTSKKDTYDYHEFASVSKPDEEGYYSILGLISYSVYWATKSVTDVCVISFIEKEDCNSISHNMQFANDILQAMDDVFYKYGMNRLEFSCVVGNKVLPAYEKFTAKYGGCQCAYYHDYTMLTDGKLYDFVEFEIMAKDYKRNAEIIKKEKEDRRARNDLE